MNMNGLKLTAGAAAVAAALAESGREMPVMTANMAAVRRRRECFILFSAMLYSPRPWGIAKPDLHYRSFAVFRREDR